MLTKLWMKIKEKPFEICLTLLLIVQVCLIFLSNLTLINCNLDCDSAKLLKHIITMWEEKTPAIPHWSYTTTLEWDCTALFAVPLYGVTGNIYLACALSNLILLIILIAAIFFLFHKERKIYPLFCANLLCIPYGIGMLDYYNMLFFAGSQYIVKVTVPIILAGLILAIENKYNTSCKRSMIVFSMLYFVLLLISCISSNIYVAACGLVPIFAVYFFYKFIKWERASFKTILLCLETVFCALVGMKCNNVLMGGGKQGFRDEFLQCISNVG